MSTTPAAAPLTAVTKPKAQLGQVPFLVSLGVLVLGGLVFWLNLSIKIEAGAMALSKAQAQVTASANEVAVLKAENDRFSSTTSLAQQAAALGMCPNPYGAFLTLPDGTVSGDPQRVTGHELPIMVPPPAGPAAPPIQVKVYPAPTPTVPSPSPAGDANPAPQPSPSPSPDAAQGEDH